MRRATVGYTGGAAPSPTYASVCAGDGHTEVVDVVYDGARSTNGSYESCRVLPNAQDPRVRVLRVHGLAPDPWVRVVRVLGARRTGPAGSGSHGSQVRKADVQVQTDPGGLYLRY